MPNTRLVLVALVFCNAGAVAQDAPAPVAGDRYYVAVFSGQDVPARKLAHLFATVLKATPGPTGAVYESHTISWMPVALPPELKRVRPEPGRNMGLEETVRYCQQVNARVTMWGPFEIHADYFAAFLRHKAELDSGQYQYRAAYARIRKTNVSDCIHGVTDIEPTPTRARYGMYRYGDRASAFLSDQLRANGALVDSGVRDEVTPVLGLAGYPVHRAAMPPERAYPLADLMRAIRRDSQPFGH